MPKKLTLRHSLFCSAAVLIAQGACAATFNIPPGSLEAALDAYSAQTGISIVVANRMIEGVTTRGVVGEISTDAALSRILKGTGFIERRDSSGTIGIVRVTDRSSNMETITPLLLAQAAPSARATVETVTVTSSKLGGADVQSIPIAITALSQEQLTATQTAGGPDLVKQVPNLTFTKTNFTGYSIQIRGIGTQAISVTTDPAVAVALNDTPFIRNHFFEQEFYDLSQAEVLRGPQGTLYGRNATAGVVNLITAKPTDQFEAMASGDIGNYENRRFEGMINIPILDDRIDLRLAGEWTKRSGYTINENNGQNVDGRDLWSSRVTLGWKPVANLQTYVVWEHFSENDDRMRTAKQLCRQDPGPSNVLGVPVADPSNVGSGLYLAFTVGKNYLSQGCLPASLYSADSFQVPYGYALPIVEAGYVSQTLNPAIDPYGTAKNSRDLRSIETQIDPRYLAKSDTIELNSDYKLSPALTLTSQTGYNNDFLWSTEDYNRFNTAPGIFVPHPFSGPSDPQLARHDSLISPYSDCSTDFSYANGQINPLPPDGTYYFNDPQLGCSNRIVAQDLSTERAWQLSQEIRLASNFSGPFNFSVGGNYMHYETVEDYYVFANTLTLFAASSTVGNATLPPWVAGVSDNHECLTAATANGGEGHQYHNPNLGAGRPDTNCYYIDPNPLESLNGQGHSYFRSQNPYLLDSYAGFGEAYYNVVSDLKLTGGIRWTDDEKHFIDIPSQLLTLGLGFLPTATVNQNWGQFTGRFAANWTPKLDFTDQTLLYGSFAHGYKAGGANPPGATLTGYQPQEGQGVPAHPLTFKPEFIDAYELGTKNTLLDGGLTLNGDIFFYNYTGYQISEIVDRTAINNNFNATVKGSELEITYEPLQGLRLKFAGGYEQTRIKDGQFSIDLMDRTAGHPGWMVMKPFVTQASNCVFPDYVVLGLMNLSGALGSYGVSACGLAYNAHVDPVNVGSSGPQSYDPSTNIPLLNGQNYHGFDPLAGTAGDPYTGQNTYNGVDYGPAPNNGEGFAKDVGGNELPNAPRFTVSGSADYTMPVTPDWAGTVHVDYYWQDYSWARVFNDRPYDRIRGYTNINLALILTNQNGWQVMGYLKNVFDTTAITGDFLNSDDSGLTTNVFLTDPRLFGLRVTKNW